MKALVGCAGFGGVEIALRGFGLDVTGIEIDPAIAEVNRRNGGNCLTSDLLDVAPANYAGWFLYHFSPPCPSFSVASQGGETETDLALARKICEFIRIGRPTIFTLENVWGYRKSLSWHLIQYTLMEEGYGLDAWHLNSADYGVPQSRRRMIAIARRDGRQPAKPFPTHSKAGDMFTQPWRGWFGAIEDLIPLLKETELAPWQRDRWPAELGDYLIMTGNTNRDGIDNKPGRGYLSKEQPANTVSAGPKGGALPKAVLIPGDNTSNGVIRFADEPMVTIQTRSISRCPHRAVILGQGSRSEPKAADQPADTVTANGNQTGIKAIIINGGNSNQSVPTVRTTDQPVFTVIANSARSPMKLITGSKTVSINTRCLARFQDFPDTFILPDDAPVKDDWIFDRISPRELSCRGTGNALPPGLYRAVLKSLGGGDANVLIRG